LEGTDAVLHRGYNLITAAGGFSISEQVVKLSFGRSIFPEAGDFLIDGQPTQMRATRVLLAESGVFGGAGEGLDIILVENKLAKRISDGFYIKL
jgi:hypothetical protein